MEEVRRRVLRNHRETLAATIDAGETVAAAWPAETVSDGDAITGPLGALLDERALPPALLDVLATAVAATGGTLQADPVPAPPYFVVTSRGPVVRATLTDGRRLVVELELFGVDRRPTTYRFLDPTPEECLCVHAHECRES